MSIGLVMASDPSDLCKGKNLVAILTCDIVISQMTERVKQLAHQLSDSSNSNTT